MSDGVETVDDGSAGGINSPSQLLFTKSPKAGGASGKVTPRAGEGKATPTSAPSGLSLPPRGSASQQATPQQRTNPYGALLPAGAEGPIVVRVDKVSARRRRLLRKKSLRNKLCFVWLSIISFILLVTAAVFWTETSNTKLLARIQDLESQLAQISADRISGDQTLDLRITNEFVVANETLRALDEVSRASVARLLVLEDFANTTDFRVTTLEANDADKEIRVSTLEANDADKEIRVTILETNSTSTINRTTVLEANDADKEVRVSTLEENDADKEVRVSTLEANDADKEVRVTTLEANDADKEVRVTTLEANDADKEIRVTTLEANDADKEIRVTTLEANDADKEIRVTQLEADNAQTLIGLDETRGAVLPNQVFTTNTDHAGPVNGLVAVKPAGWFASGGSDGTVRVWDVIDTSTQLAPSVSRPGVPSPIRALVRLIGGDLCACDAEGHVARWNLDPVATGASPTLVGTWVAHNDQITGALGLPDGTLATASLDFTIRIWNPATEALLSTLGSVGNINSLSGHLASVSSIAVLEDSANTIISGDQLGEILLWSGTAILRRLSLAVAEGSSAAGGVQAMVALNPGPTGNPRVAAAYSDFGIRLWDTTTATISGVLTGHNGVPRTMFVLADAGLVSGDTRGELFLWSTFREGRLLYQLETVASVEITSLTALPDATMIHGDLADTISVWRKGYSSPGILV